MGGWLRCRGFCAPPGRLELSARSRGQCRGTDPCKLGSVTCIRSRRGHTCAECTLRNNNNNNNTIWGGSVLTGEEPPPHSGELKHALPQAGGPTQSQLSRPMSSRHHISMEHQLRRKQLNSDTNASNKKYLKEIQEKRKEETFSSEKMKKENEKH